MYTATGDQAEMDRRELEAYRKTNLTPSEITLMSRQMLFIKTALDSDDDYAPRVQTESYPIPEDFWEE